MIPKKRRGLFETEKVYGQYFAECFLLGKRGQHSSVTLGWSEPIQDLLVLGVFHMEFIYQDCRFRMQVCLSCILFGAMIGGPFIGWLTSRLNAIKKHLHPYSYHCVFQLDCVIFIRCETSIYYRCVFAFYNRFWQWSQFINFCGGQRIIPYERSWCCNRICQYGRVFKCSFIAYCFRKYTDLFPQHSMNIGYHYGFTIPILFSLMGFIGVLLIKEEKAKKTVLSAT